MKRLLYVLLALSAFASACTLRATAGPAGNPLQVARSPALAHARRAQALLGAETWSRVIRVENTATHSRYPATVFALVFEEAGLLWFYTDADGTQSLSLHPGRLAEEKADLAPLLLEIDPGFATYELLTSDGERTSRSVFEHGPGGPYSVSDRALPNGCFVESLAALRDRVERGEQIARARLLNCYVDTPAGRRGHTVLTYETPRGLFLLDPGRSPEPRQVPRAWADDAMALAGAALQGVRVAQARWVPTALPFPAAAVAFTDFSNEPGPGAAPRLMR